MLLHLIVLKAITIPYKHEAPHFLILPSAVQGKVPSTEFVKCRRMNKELLCMQAAYDACSLVLDPAVGGYDQ